MSILHSAVKILSAPIWLPYMLFFKYRFLILKMIFWTIVAVLLFSSCSFVVNLDWLGADNHKNMRIAQARYGQYKLHIPDVFGSPVDGELSTQLQTMFPGAEVLEPPSGETWEDGGAEQIIETSIDYLPQSKMSFSGFLDHKVAVSRND